MFPHFLVAIADLTHPLSNNRSSVRIIGCYKYINHQAGTTKASTINMIILIQMYNIFRLLIGVPDYSSESYRDKQKLIGFIVIISQRGVCKS